MKQRVIIVCATLSLVCLGAWAIQAQTASSGQAPAATIAGKSVPADDPAHIAFNRQTSVDCNICFTCGGDWPIFAGMIRSSPANPTERGGSCSGSLITRTDSSPFLCCK
jgi:hypothetical protein